MDTLQCAVVLAKLERFEWELERRAALGARYGRLLADVEGATPVAVRQDRDCVWAQYTVLVDPTRRADVQAALAAAGVPTTVHYPAPVHHQPAYARHAAPGDSPRSIALAAQVLSLPMSADLDEADQERVVAALAAALRGP